MSDIPEVHALYYAFDLERDLCGVSGRFWRSFCARGKRYRLTRFDILKAVVAKVLIYRSRYFKLLSFLRKVPYDEKSKRTATTSPRSMLDESLHVGSWVAFPRAPTSV